MQKIKRFSMDLRKMYWLAIALCFGLAFLVRLYHIDSVPNGIHVDEAGMAYDAWSLVHYGVDRFQMSYPVYFTNFGGGQNALYTYLCMLFIKIFGGGHVNILLMRLPGIAINLLAYLAGVYLIRETYGKRWAIVGAFLLAILPYFVMQCRFGLESNLLVNMLTISVTALWIAAKKEKKRFYLIAGVLWGITYYAYAISYIANTVMLLVFFSYFLAMSKEKKKVIKNWICLFIPVLLLGLPLLLMLVVNHFDLPQFQIGVLTITKLPGYRGEEISFSNIRDNLPLMFKTLFLRDWLPYNALDHYYTMYVFSIPFIILGFCVSLAETVKKILIKENSIVFICICIFLCYFLTGLLIGGDNVNVNRMNGIFFAQFFMLVTGLRWFIRLIKKKFPVCAAGVLCVILSTYAFAFLNFVGYYFGEFAAEKVFLFSDTYAGCIKELETRGKADKMLYIDQNMIYYFLGQEISPYDAPFKEVGPDVYEYLSVAGAFSDDAFENVYAGNAVIICLLDNEEVFELMKEHGVKEQFTCGMYACFYISDR